MATTQFHTRNVMDIIKAVLIFCIAGALYYLLLQWPDEPESTKLVGGEESKQSFFKEGISDSEDLLLSMDPDPERSPPPTVIGRVFSIENDDTKVSIEALTGRVVSSFLKQIYTDQVSGQPLLILGSTERNLYFANSGYFNRELGYINPNYTNLKRVDVPEGLRYVLTGESNNMVFRRTINMKRSGHSLEITEAVTSKQDKPLEITPYVVIERDSSPPQEDGLAMTYLGPVFSTEKDVYQKYDFGDINSAPYREKSKGGWVAFIQHYFLSAWIPAQEKESFYQGRWSNSSNRYTVGYTLKDEVLLPGGSLSHTNVLYVGPKYPYELAEIQENLSLTVDYGFLWWLGKPMYWFLSIGNELFKSWGLAIVFLTVVLKFLLWPLSAKAYRSMGKMREFGPELQSIQARYGNDKQKSAQEMMDLYKREGINPLGGCLPMLLQMPFFLAFYWVLMETVELRHSPFLWIDDLSAKDPYFILPILNGVGMYLSQMLTPTPPNADPLQAQMMKYFPVVFAVIFAWFPSGLVLYWLVNMFLQIGQQWWYGRSTQNQRS